MLEPADVDLARASRDRKSTRLNSSHTVSSYAVFCLKKKTGPFVRNDVSEIKTPKLFLIVRFASAIVRKFSSLNTLLVLTGIISMKRFFFNDTATTEIYTLSLPDALPISVDDESGERLEQRRDGVEHRRHHAERRIRHAELLAHQRKEWRQHELHEVAGRVAEGDERDDERIVAPHAFSLSRNAVTAESVFSG